MASIPQTDSTVSLIYRAWAKRENRPPRSHLGASMIGRPCEREAWYAFHWALYPEFEGRILRLFDRGQREEPVFIRDLRQAGITVHAVDPETGKQFQFSDFGGHVGGSMDGAALGLPEAPKTWHVLEFKTHSIKSFDATVRDGVQKAHPEHYAQMQMYMGWSGMDRALYLAVNKDNDELYSERVEFAPAVFEKLRGKAQRIVFCTVPMPRISESAAFFRCKTCHFHSICHGGGFPRANCRTCAYAIPTEGGTWHCSRHEKVRSVDEQRAGCPQHLLLTHAMPVQSIDAGKGWVMYEIEKGKDCFLNAEEGVKPTDEASVFTSQELSLLTLETLPPAIRVKLELGGTVIEMESTT